MSRPQRCRLVPWFSAAWLAAAAALSGPGLGVRPALAADAPVAGYTIPLFDGAGLDRWVVTGCDVRVDDGRLVLADGDGLVRTHHRYRDFELEFDWRPLRDSMYDAGIYFRCDLPPEGKPWPRRYQINLKQGDEGNLIGVPGARSTGLIKAGEWNHFKLRVVGHNAELWLNGQAAWKTDQIEPEEGYVGIQVEVPLGGQHAFRDIRLTELGFTSLFNGKDLEGWEGGGGDAASCWQVEQGELVCTGAKGPWLRSIGEHGDFNVRLEYKLKEGGNSGVYIRVPESGNHHGKDAGIEVQVLDDAAPRYANLQPYQYSASLYALVPASPRVARPAGEWNSLEINCRGGQYRVTHNGVVVVDADESSQPALVERLKSGRLGLQNHSERIWYRNLRVGPAQ